MIFINSKCTSINDVPNWVEEKHLYKDENYIRLINLKSVFILEFISFHT